MTTEWSRVLHSFISALKVTLLELAQPAPPHWHFLSVFPDWFSLCCLPPSDMPYIYIFYLSLSKLRSELCKVRDNLYLVSIAVVLKLLVLGS